MRLKRPTINFNRERNNTREGEDDIDDPRSVVNVNSLVSNSVSIYIILK